MATRNRSMGNICDICGTSDPHWLHRALTESIVVSGRTMGGELLATAGMSGDFGLCTPCSDVVEKRDISGIVIRALNGELASGLAPLFAQERAVLMSMLTDIYSAIVPTWAPREWVE